MKLEHLLYAVLLYVFVHYLLAKQNLNPTLRSLLQPVESKALTQVFVDLAIA